jgi:hypothetical protein
VVYGFGQGSWSLTEIAELLDGRLPGSTARFDQTTTVVSFLLSVTFACGLFIALAHVMNQQFIAPVYDVAANLTAFGCAVAASSLLGHPVPAMLSAVAILCWLVLARRTILDRRRNRSGDKGEASPSTDSN